MEDNNPTTAVSSEETENEKFISSAYKGKNSFWRYAGVSLLPFAASNTIGAIPLVVLLVVLTLQGRTVTGADMANPTALGINLNLYLALMLFPFIVALLTMMLLIKPLHARSFGTVINGGRPLRWRRMLTSAMVWLAVSGLYMWFTIKTNPSNFVINNATSSLITLAVISVLLIPVQAGFEEVLFRGYLMQGFAVLTRNRWMPIIITSVLFGLMHSLNPEVMANGFWVMMPQYILFGLIFAVVSMLDDGIEIAIGAHAANNAFISVFLTTHESVLQTPALFMQLKTYPWQDLLGTAASGALFLMIMMFVYKWKDFGLLYRKIVRPAPVMQETQMP